MRNARLTHYRDRLLELRGRLAAEMGHQLQAIRDDVTASADLSHFPTHAADHDSEGLDRDLAVARTEADILSAVEQSLERIEKGVYGLCRDCRVEISKARLDAIPYAALCVDCARRRESPRPA
jgi:RNA polymerase-binding protein DksA